MPISFHVCRALAQRIAVRTPARDVAPELRIFGDIEFAPFGGGEPWDLRVILPLAGHGPRQRSGAFQVLGVGLTYLVLVAAHEGIGPSPGKVGPQESHEHEYYREPE